MRRPSDTSAARGASEPSDGLAAAAAVAATTASGVIETAAAAAALSEILSL